MVFVASSYSQKVFILFLVLGAVFQELGGLPSLFTSSNTNSSIT